MHKHDIPFRQIWFLKKLRADIQWQIAASENENGEKKKNPVDTYIRHVRMRKQKYRVSRFRRFLGYYKHEANWEAPIWQEYDSNLQKIEINIPSISQSKL